MEMLQLGVGHGPATARRVDFAERREVSGLSLAVMWRLREIRHSSLHVACPYAMTRPYHSGGV